MEFALLILCLAPMIFFIGAGVGFLVGRALARSADPRRQFADLVRFWQQSQQIDAASAERILLLLYKQPGVQSSADTTQLAAQPASTMTVADHTSPLAATAGMPSSPPIPSMPVPVSLPKADQVLPPPPVAPAVTVSMPTAPESTAPPTDAADDSQTVPPLLTALLSMEARRTLLIIGSFLILISSLVLVIFNWNRFPPLVQVGLLSVFTGSLWGGGYWMQRRTALVTAGRNLSSVAMLMLPVVLFSFTRPGLFDLDGRLASFVVSVLSCMVYTVAAWQSRRLFYSLTASAAACAALYSSFLWWSVDGRWQPIWSFVLWSVALIIAHQLNQSTRSMLVPGPRIVSIAGPALSISVSLGLFLANPIAAEAPTTITVLLLGAAFGVALAWLNDQPAWLWATALLVPLATMVGVVLPVDGLTWINLSFASLTLIYPIVAAVLEQRLPAYSRPFLVLMPILVVVALATALDRVAIVRSYPILIGTTLLVVGLIEWRRLVLWQPHRTLVGTIVVSIQLGLVTIWAGSFVNTWELRSLIAVVIGGLVFIVSAIPLGHRLAYAPAVWCYGGAFLIAVGTILSIVLDPTLRLVMPLIAALLYGWRAVRYRQSLWAWAALAAGLALCGVMLDRVGWLANLDHYLLASVLFASGLSIGGSLIGKHVPAYKYWTAPALFWAGTLGCISGILFVNAFLAPSLAAVIAALVGSATIVLLGIIYHRWQTGYLTALLLLAAWMMALFSDVLPWNETLHSLSILAILLAVGYGCLALIMRSRSPFDRPYAQFGLGTAFLLPLPASIELIGLLFTNLPSSLLRDLTLAAASSAMFMTIGAFVYRRWRLISLALLQSFLAFGSAVHWVDGANQVTTGWSLLLIASLIALGSAFVHRRYSVVVVHQLVYDSYLLSSIANLVALSMLFTGSVSSLSLPLLVLLAGGYGFLTLIRRSRTPFDRPYAQFGLATSFLLPLPALLELIAFTDLTSPVLRDLTLAAISSAVFMIIGAFVYRRWRLISLALLQSFLAFGSAVHWVDGANRVTTGWSLLLIASLIALGSAFVHRRYSVVVVQRLVYDSYLLGGVANLVALSMLFTGSVSSLSLPLLVLAVVIGVIAQLEQRVAGASLSLIALLGCIASSLALTPLSPPWQAAWFVLTLVPLLLIGGFAARLNSTRIWQQPTLWVPLIAACILGFQALFDLRAGVIALVNGGVLLVTATFRERRSIYAYLAGAVFVTASLGQFLVWELREVQLYVVPVGIYLFALAAGIRIFQRQVSVARLVDSAAVCLLLGVTFIQAGGSGENVGYVMLFGGESLLVMAYGILARLRVPFISGVIGFVIGVLWMVAHATRMLNQWLVLGLLGMLMLLAYVLLERQQEQLRRFSRDLVVRLREWQ
jgi:hypothetical protein